MAKKPKDKKEEEKKKNKRKAVVELDSDDDDDDDDLSDAGAEIVAAKLIKAKQANKKAKKEQKANDIASGVITMPALKSSGDLLQQ